MARDVAAHVKAAFWHVPDPPCDRGCEHRPRCAAEELACEDFARYCGAPASTAIRVAGLRGVRIPSRATFQRVFRPTDGPNLNPRPDDGPR